MPPKGSKSTKKKNTDPNKPKNPASSYAFFVREMRPSVGQANQGRKTTDIMRFIAQQWTALDTAGKQKYVDMSNEDKRRYQEAMKTYVPPPDVDSSVPLVKPKNPGSAYTYFVREVRPSVAEQFKEMTTTDIMRYMGEQWRAMDGEQKQKFVDMAESDKVRYRQAMKAFQTPDENGNMRLEGMPKCKRCGLIRKGHNCPFPVPQKKKRRKRTNEGEYIVEPEDEFKQEQEPIMDVVTRTVNFVEKQMYGDGHDMTHSLRVWKLSLKLAREEGINTEHDLEVIQLASLLHDIAEWKYSSDRKHGGFMASKFLSTAGCNKAVIARVVHIIENGDFETDNPSNYNYQNSDKLLACIQDAYHLDAIGAIGIARAFSQGGRLQTPLYTIQKANEDVASTPNDVMTRFGERLFKLKDMMRTNAGRNLAIERHEFMKVYIDKFHKEIDCE